MKNYFFLLMMPFFCKGQIVETIAGTGAIGYTGDGGMATNAELNQPCGVRFDHSGNIYIADWQNGVVRKINTSGVISTVAGNGIGGYTGDGGPATAAELGGPTDIAFDSEGNMFICDNGNDVIRKVTTSGIISTYAGIASSFSYNGDGIQATAANLNFPLGLAIDTVGNLYISDEDNHRIRKVSPAGIITTVAGNGTSGESGDNGPATNAELINPGVLAFSPNGDLYIPDLVEHRVRKISSSGIITTVAGNGSRADDGDGGPATAAGISQCQAVVFDNSGNYYISNNVSCSIRKVNASGTITTATGNDSCGYNGDNTPATATLINYSFSTATDGAGNLYFGDPLIYRVRRITYKNTNSVASVNSHQQNLTIYPNPAQNEITITSPDNIESITLTNMVGQEVAAPIIFMKDKESMIGVASLQGGVYFVRVNGVYAGKFVKD